MAFKAHKEFFDALVFLGMRSADDGVRKACKCFFTLRFRGVALIFREGGKFLPLTN